MSSRQPINILMVDDQPAKLLSYETILGGLNENLIRASSGAEALDLLLRTEIAVVLMDVCMPELDGFELAAMIRSHPRFQKTSIILISGVMTEDAHRVKGYDSGAVDYISVPIIPEILRSKVAIFAELYRKTEELRQLNNQLAVQSVKLQEELIRRRSAEEQLRLHSIELERSNTELQQFANVASHDLQEPLRMVASYIGLLAETYQGKLSPEADEFIGFAVDGAARMKQLISDLLDYSHVQAGRGELVLTDCEAVLRETLAGLKIVIDESKAIITSDPLPSIWASPSQMRQLFQNVLSNALKFTGSHAPRVHVSATRGDGEWIFSITDNGIGISNEHTERIFGIFQRLHTREQYPGTGIGLAVCKKIVEGHGGRIWVSSEPDRGSTFSFVISSEVNNSSSGAQPHRPEGGVLSEVPSNIAVE